MHTNFLLSACQMYSSWYLFFFWNLPLSCGCGARVIDSTISSRKSTDSDDDIQSPLILRWMKALKGVWNEQLRDKWKIFFCSQKRRERKGEKERRKKNCPNPLVVFHTSRTKRIGNECVCPIFFVRLSIHLDNNFVGPERVPSSFPGISKSFRGGLSPRP